MRTIPRGVAVMCVLAAWLAMPARADACISQTVMISFLYDYSEIVASTNAQVDPYTWPCDWWDQDMYAHVTVETPYTTLDKVSEWGQWEATATTTVPYDEHGWGWYTAEGYATIIVTSPQAGMPEDTGKDYDYHAVPAPTLEFTGGPTEPVPQHSTGVMVTISVDPWYWAQHVDFQGCTPTGNPYLCEVDTGSVGQKTITAKIDDGPAQGVSDQWLVEVE